MPYPEYQGFSYAPLAAGIQNAYQNSMEAQRLQLQQHAQQAEQALATQRQEAEYGPMSGKQVINPDIFNAPSLSNALQTGAQSGAAYNPGSNVYNAQTGQTIKVGRQGNQQAQQPQESQPSDPHTASNQAAQIAEQKGMSVTPSGEKLFDPQAVKQEDFSPGKQDDGTFVAKNGTVYNADKVRQIEQSAGEIDPSSGAITVPNYVAHQMLNSYGREQGAIANVMSRGFTAAARPAPVKTVSPGGGGRNNKLDPNTPGGFEKLVTEETSKDPIIKALNTQLAGLSNPISGQLNPNASQLIGNLQNQIAQRQNIIRTGLTQRMGGSMGTQATQPPTQPPQGGVDPQALIVQYQQKHNVDQATAQTAVMAYLKSKGLAQ